MLDFIDQHFDRIILIILILVFGAAALKGGQFAQRECDILVGALLTLIVQRVKKDLEPPSV